MVELLPSQLDIPLRYSQTPYRRIIKNDPCDDENDFFNFSISQTSANSSILSIKTEENKKERKMKGPKRIKTKSEYEMSKEELIEVIHRQKEMILSLSRSKNVSKAPKKEERKVNRDGDGDIPMLDRLSLEVKEVKKEQKRRLPKTVQFSDVVA